MAEIGDDAQVGRDGPDAPDAAFVHQRRELVEHPVEVHEVAFGLGLANAHPLGVPGVIEGVAGFRQQVARPFAVVEHAQDGRRFVPARGVQGVAVPFSGAGVLFARNFDEGVTLDDTPRFAIPFGQASRRAFAQELGFFVGIVGHDEAALCAVSTLEMGLAFDIEFPDQVGQLARLEGLEVRLEKQPFHGHEIDHGLGMHEVPGRGRETVFGQGLDGTHVAFGVNNVGTNDGLQRFPVYEAVSKRAGDGLRVQMHGHIVADFIQPDALPADVGDIADGPEPVSPRNQRPDARLAAAARPRSKNGHIGKHPVDLDGRRFLRVPGRTTQNREHCGKSNECTHGYTSGNVISPAIPDGHSRQVQANHQAFC